MGDVDLLKPQSDRRDLMSVRMKREVAAKVGEVLREALKGSEGADAAVIAVKAAIRPWVGKVLATGIELGWREIEEMDMQTKVDEVENADSVMKSFSWHWHEKKEVAVPIAEGGE